MNRISRYVCSTCKDTHKMWLTSENRYVMCTRCPIPCQKCRLNGNGAYCTKTPCSCACHSYNKPSKTASLNHKLFIQELISLCKKYDTRIEGIDPNVLIITSNAQEYDFEDVESYYIEFNAAKQVKEKLAK